MKAVTEFANVTLSQALKTKAALTAEGKTPEEIQESLGQSFKMEGDKLKYFINALDVAGQNTTNLKRVLVVSFAEGENVPGKASKVDELHYVPDFFVMSAPKPAETGKGHGKGGRQGGGGRGAGGGAPKGSPWGLSPEEKAMKNKKAAPVKPS